MTTRSVATRRWRVVTIAQMFDRGQPRVDRPLGLVARGLIADATVRPPLLPLGPGAGAQVTQALRQAGVEVTAEA